MCIAKVKPISIFHKGSGFRNVHDNKSQKHAPFLGDLLTFSVPVEIEMNTVKNI